MFETVNNQKTGKKMKVNYAYQVNLIAKDSMTPIGFVPQYFAKLDAAMDKAIDLAYADWPLGEQPTLTTADFSRCKQSVQDNRCGFVQTHTRRVVVSVITIQD